MLVSLIVLGLHRQGAGWPRGLPSRLPGLRRIEGQPAIPNSSTRSRIGEVRDDGTVWIQPLILGEPPRLCTWDHSRIAFPAPRWRRKAIAMMRRHASGQIAEVVVLNHRREPWKVTFAANIGTAKEFDLPGTFLYEGLATAKDPTDRSYRSVEQDARAHHRGMFAKR